MINRRLFYTVKIKTNTFVFVDRYNKIVFSAHFGFNAVGVSADDLIPVVMCIGYHRKILICAVPGKRAGNKQLICSSGALWINAERNQMAIISLTGIIRTERKSKRDTAVFGNIFQQVFICDTQIIVLRQKYHAQRVVISGFRTAGALQPAAVVSNGVVPHVIG